jgi:hypothetical protein
MLEKQILCASVSLFTAVAVLQAEGMYVGNDTCVDGNPAMELTDDNAQSLPQGYSNVGATTNGQPHVACASNSGDEQIHNDIWFLVFVQTVESSDPPVPVPGPLTISLAGSDFDTKMAVYEGTAEYPSECNCDGPQVLVACNDDCNGLQSQVTFVPTRRCFFLRIGGATPGSVGTVFITFTRPEALLNQLIADVQALDDTGAPPNDGQVNSLTKKLESAKAQLSMGKTTPAINKLQAFINEVDALLGSGTLTAAQATDLKNKANQLIAANSC